MLAFFAIVFGIVFLDQLSKWLVVIFLKGEGSFNIINNVLRFTYLENRGAAFGMLDDNRWIFLVVSTVMIIAITFYVIKYRPQNKWAYAACAFVVGGGIGNMIDRVALGYVIDFIDFCAFPKIWYYVFNVADSFVCVGAGMLMVYLVFSIVTESRAEKAIKLDERGDDKAPDDQEGAEPENAVLADAESDTVISEDTDSSDTAESEESAGDE